MHKNDKTKQTDHPCDICDTTGGLLVSGLADTVSKKFFRVIFYGPRHN